MTVVTIISVLAVIVIPMYLRARDTSEKNSCLNNLRLIDDAKQEWALESNKVTGDTPRNADLAPFLRNHLVPGCPTGGIYNIANIGAVPSCTITGHSL